MYVSRNFMFWMDKVLIFYTRICGDQEIDSNYINWILISCWIVDRVKFWRLVHSAGVWVLSPQKQHLLTLIYFFILFSCLLLKNECSFSSPNFFRGLNVLNPADSRAVMSFSIVWKYCFIVSLVSVLRSNSICREDGVLHSID